MPQNLTSKYHQHKKLGLCVNCDNRARPGKLRCERCAETQRRWRKAHNDETLEKSRAWRADYYRRTRSQRIAEGLCIRCGHAAEDGLRTCKKCNAYSRNWAKKNPERAKELERASRSMSTLRSERKAKVFQHYGDSCACCGESEPLFLTIDHIQNDGAQHRKQINARNGTDIYRWIVLHDFPVGLQTLCRNCNWGKHANGGICPHKSLISPP